MNALAIHLLSRRSSDRNRTTRSPNTNTVEGLNAEACKLFSEWRRGLSCKKDDGVDAAVMVSKGKKGRREAPPLPTGARKGLYSSMGRESGGWGRGIQPPARSLVLSLLVLRSKNRPPRMADWMAGLGRSLTAASLLPLQSCPYRGQR